ncbi:hypothetical protein HK100_005457 [Physocladia obscura]|uniref:Intradiol ring-cleavage dioxygenases domain-containing protein n=1 Tax=Physocladia obscura TaxID=109957 RepID=A0AAD5T5X9_9FUNG|nr:hypothetical protein HK100_005457 [Physocladia obscura]
MIYIAERDSASVLAKSHKSSKTGVTQSSNATAVFGTSVACILQPEVTYGPYYVSGEYIRHDMRESQLGVDLYVDVQVIDTSSCTTIPGIYIELWHCNSTGVYSGVVASGNGNSADTSNLNATFHRGLFKTNSDGIAQGITKFPGHYTGRASHIHVIAHMNGTILANNTYISNNYAHIGQIFFDQDLISSVEATSPYSTNTQQLTTNSKDNLLAEETGNSFDPIVQYVWLGDFVSDGIFAWISIGVNTQYNQAVSPAAYLTAHGGVANANGGFFGPGGGVPSVAGAVVSVLVLLALGGLAWYKGADIKDFVAKRWDQLPFQRLKE